jgi:hypothetical protein
MIEKVSQQEFIEYYAHVSSFIEQDAAFLNLINSVWGLDLRNEPEILPFAGGSGKGKVLVVDPKQKMQQDTYKGKYG